MTALLTKNLCSYFTDALFTIYAHLQLLTGAFFLCRCLFFIIRLLYLLILNSHCKYVNTKPQLNTTKVATGRKKTIWSRSLSAQLNLFSQVYACSVHKRAFYSCNMLFFFVLIFFNFACFIGGKRYVYI